MSINLSNIIYHNSRTLSYKFPNVREILVKYKRKSGSFDGAKDVEWREYKVFPNDKFCIHILCINGTCTRGWIDLTNEVEVAVRANKTSLASEEECKGSEDKKREDRFSCLSIVEYQVFVEYLEGLPL